MNLEISPIWLASNPKGPAWICLLNTEIIDVHYTDFYVVLGPELRYPGLHHNYFTNWAISLGLVEIFGVLSLCFLLALLLESHKGDTIKTWGKGSMVFIARVSELWSFTAETWRPGNPEGSLLFITWVYLWTSGPSAKIIIAYVMMSVKVRTCCQVYLQA